MAVSASRYYSIFLKLDEAPLLLRGLGCQGELQSPPSVIQGADWLCLPTTDKKEVAHFIEKERISLKTRRGRNFQPFTRLGLKMAQRVG